MELSFYILPAWVALKTFSFLAPLSYYQIATPKNEISYHTGNYSRVTYLCVRPRENA